MSSFLGIEKEKDCVYLYVILDSRFREMEAEQDEERDQYYFSVPDSVREEADRQVEQWMGEPREDTLRDRKMRTWRKAEEFVEQCLNQQGYGEIMRSAAIKSTGVSGMLCLGLCPS